MKLHMESLLQLNNKRMRQSPIELINPSLMVILNSPSTITTLMRV
jgi:hypothetical protein